MDYYSFRENKLLRQDYLEGSTYDLFQPTLTDEKLARLDTYPHIVTVDQDGRLDKVSTFLYDGEDKYTEELMKINNIINPNSIKVGDIIFYLSLSDMSSLYVDDIDTTSKVDVMNINNPKNSGKDANRQAEMLPPVVKDSNSKQLYWNKDNKSITISNKIS